MKFALIYLITSLLFSGNPVNIYYDPNKLHHTPDGFTNPYLNVIEQNKNFSDLFKMMREDRPGVSEMLDVIKVSKQNIDAHINAKKNFYLWIGHSTALIHINGKIILTDPIFSDRCSPLKFIGPKRYSEPAISIEDLPMIDLIVISHNHYDHLDYQTVKKIGDNTLWIVPLGLKKWFFNQGVENVKEMDWYDSFNHDGIEVVSLPSQHWSKRTVFKSFDTLWSSWSIEVDDFKFWFAGDTGYNDIQFKEIGKDYGPFDLAAIPIGAYAPRWFMKNFHIDPEEAVQIHEEIFSRLSVGIHYGTFILTTEPIEEPIIKLQEAIKKYNLNPKEFLTIGIGEFIFL